MIPGLELIKKIHAGADDTCYSSILTTWEEKSRYERLEELMSLLCKGMDMQTAVNQLHITPAGAKALLKDCEHIRMDKGKRCMYDHMLQTSIFLDQCEEMMFTQAEDVYYSLNSFYKPEKAGSNVRHINAMVLDFSQYLLAWSDKLVELKTICFCGRKASMVLRLDQEGRPYNEGEQVVIGGNERYVSVCRKHYKEALSVGSLTKVQNQHRPC